MNSKRLGDLLILGIVIMVVIVINQLSSIAFFRIDLTEENRYSISASSKEILAALEEPLYLDVYLEGDLPAGFQRLQRSIKETLDEFAVYSDGKVQYQFVDPEAAAGSNSRNEFLMGLVEKGLQPTDVFLTKNGERIQKRIVPGAIISYRGVEQGVLLLKGNRGAPSEIRLNQSIEGVEYELISAIRDLSNQDLSKVVYDIGHGEPNDQRVAALKQYLEERFIFQVADISKMDVIDNSIKTLIITKPTERFTESDKFKLDQFLLNGGNLLLNIDALEVNMDSIYTGTYSFPYDHNLDDLFFRYGFRVNKNLIQDYQSGATPVVVGNFGEDTQINLLPWPFYPVVNVYNNHPIVRNMDAIQMKFVSTIDTVKADGVIKTPLFFSSPYSKVFSSPVRVIFDDLRKPMDPAQFNERNLPVAYLLEGEFSSLYRNRLLPQELQNKPYRETGSGKIVIIGDGDIFLNDINPRNNQPQPLGFDLNTSQQYANGDLMLNILDYLSKGDGLILARNKEVVIRPLDKARINEDRRAIQFYNLVIPVFLLILFGILKWYLRKRAYSRN